MEYEVGHDDYDYESTTSSTLTHDHVVITPATLRFLVPLYPSGRVNYRSY
jgi:hypothetical protein